MGSKDTVADTKKPAKRGEKPTIKNYIALVVFVGGMALAAMTVMWRSEHGCTPVVQEAKFTPHYVKMSPGDAPVPFEGDTTCEWNPSGIAMLVMAGLGGLGVGMAEVRKQRASVESHR